MISWSDALEKIMGYPDSQKLEISGFYSLLCADKEGIVKSVGQWPESPYPNWDRSGVYLFLDRKMGVLYIGETVMFAQRLDSHFPRKFGGRPRGIWKGDPSYIVTIALPAEASDERFAFERYLIDLLQPPNNQMGIRGED